MERIRLNRRMGQVVMAGMAALMAMCGALAIFAPNARAWPWMALMEVVVFFTGAVLLARQVPRVR